MTVVTVFVNAEDELQYGIERPVWYSLKAESLKIAPEPEEPVEDYNPKNMLILCGSIVVGLAVAAAMFLGLQMSTERRDIEKAKTDQIQARACESIEDESARTLCIMHVDD